MIISANSNTKSALTIQSECGENNVDPDQTAPREQSDQRLHCFQDFNQNPLTGQWARQKLTEGRLHHRYSRGVRLFWS